LSVVEEVPAPQVRVRVLRPSVVGRGLLLDAARQLFAARGYAGASTREIALAAGVREALIFRHFGTKSGLFRAAVTEPFRAAIEGFVDDWEAGYVPNSLPTQELTRVWIESLHDLMRGHRGLVIALLTAKASDVDDDPDQPLLSDALARPMARLEAFTRREMAGRGLSGNPTIAVRAIFGMVLSMAVLDEWFFSSVPRPGPAAITAEMTGLIVHGITGDRVASPSCRVH
jgi:AcrR family transcriptional regulator